MLLQSIIAQSSCRTIEKEVADNLLQKNVVRRQLLDLRECVTELRDEKLRLTEELNAQKVIYDELVNKVYTSMFEIRESFREQQERNDQKLIEELNKASDEVKTMQRELEEAKGGLLCQICFERRRDCKVNWARYKLYE